MFVICFFPIVAVAVALTAGQSARQAAWRGWVISQSYMIMRLIYDDMDVKSNLTYNLMEEGRGRGRCL